MLTPGVLLREVWTNLSGSTLRELTNSASNPRWPKRPHITDTVDLFEVPRDARDNYGTRLSGFVTPSVTGEHTFYLASDDQGALLLSTDETARNLRPVAREPIWNGYRQWTGDANNGSRGKPPANISAPVLLVAGQRYYVEALMKEGTGGDHLGVAWRPPGQTAPPVNGSAPIGAAFLSASLAAPGALTYSLVDPPAGAAIDPATGLLDWIPAEAQGPGVYPITVRVTDNGEPPLSAEQTFIITVDEANRAPEFPVFTIQTAIEGQPFSLAATATDPDLPANVLTYSLASGAPAGLSIGAATGVLSWAPDETQGGQSFPVTVRVSDNGTPALSASRTFTVSVAEVNQPPVLAAISATAVDEGVELTFLAKASDPDLPANALTFALAPGAPAGAVITPAGLFRWTPTEAQGPGAFPITVVVTDNGSPKLTDTKTFTVTVNEVNAAPVPSAVADQTLDLGGTLRLALTATDTDLPAQTLAFSLVSGPSGLTVSGLGALDWTPTGTQAPSTHGVTVRVDDGIAGATTSFTVIVREPPREVVLT